MVEYEDLLQTTHPFSILRGSPPIGVTALKTFAMLKVHKITEYTNAKNENRICVTFAKQSNNLLGGLASSTAFGSLTLVNGTTLAQAEDALPVGSEHPDVTFGKMDENGFYSVVAS